MNWKILMTISIRTALRKMRQDFVMWWNKTIDYNYEILPYEPSLQSFSNKSKKGVKLKVQRVVKPSVSITDKEFIYTNSAHTNVAKTFQKFSTKTGVNDANGLFNDSDTNRIKNENVVRPMLGRKIRRVQ
jgi:hypothetical protein